MPNPLKWIKSLFDSDGEESLTDSDHDEDDGEDEVKFTFAYEAIKELDDEEMEEERSERRGLQGLSILSSISGGDKPTAVTNVPTLVLSLNKAFISTQMKNYILDDVVWLRKEKNRKASLEEAMAKLYFGINDFQVIRTIGIGAFSRLKLVQHAGSQRYFVAKQMPKVELVRLKQVAVAQREKDILCTFVNRSNFILQIEGHFSDDSFLYLITEFCTGGDLAQWIQTREDRRLSEDQTQFYAMQMVMAVEHLHVRGIAHRDIKPDNIALMKDGYIKLIDFGFAKSIGTDYSIRTYTGLGTPEYLAPECIQGVGHGLPLDLWSLGILLYEMLCGKVPFYEEDPFETYKLILALDYEFPDFLWAALSAKDLIGKLLQSLPENRLGYEGLLPVKEHGFFKLSWGEVEDKKFEVPPEDIPPYSKDDMALNFSVVPEDNTEYGVLDPELEKELFLKF